MRKVKAVIERAKDGTYSIYSDNESLSYLITATGATVEEAKRNFEDSYSEMKAYYKSKRKPFEDVKMHYTTKLHTVTVYYGQCGRDYGATFSDNVPGAAVFTADTLQELKRKAEETLSFHVDGIEDAPQWLREKLYILVFKPHP